MAYHNLQDVDIEHDTPDPPQIEPSGFDIGHDEWAKAVAQQSPGTVSRFDFPSTDEKRHAFKHPFSEQASALFKDTPTTMEELCPEFIEQPLSVAEQEMINQEMAAIQQRINDLLSSLKPQEDNNVEIVSQEAITHDQPHEANAVPSQEANEAQISILSSNEDSEVNCNGTSKRKSVSFEVSTLATESTPSIDDRSTVDQQQPQKISKSDVSSAESQIKYLDWEPSMIPLLNMPVKVILEEKVIEYALTTGERTFVPMEVVISMVKGNTPPPKALSQQNAGETGDAVTSGPTTRSRARKISGKDFQHFDEKGQPMGTLAFIAKAVGKNKWKKMKAKVNKDENPKSWDKCLESEERELWIEAVYQELLSLQLRGTYTLAFPSTNDRIYSSRLVCRKKRNAFTNAVKAKARIVVQGYTQVEGIDYHDTFSPTVGAVAVRTLIACSTWLKYKLYHIDITTAFLSADIDQPFIFVRPPKGLEEPDGRIWRLNKALYGLKQSPRLWYKEITKTLRAFGFKEDPNETHLWRYLGDDGEILLCLYVDDLLFAVSDDAMYDKFYKFLASHYPIGEAGPAKEFLHVRIDQNLINNTTTMHQIPYLESLLTKFAKIRGFTARTSPLPIKLAPYFEDNLKWCDPKNHTLYREIVGSLLYLSIWTRPDIAFAVGILSRFLQRPAEEHLDLAFRVLGYLKRKPLPGLVYSREGSQALSRLVNENDSLVLYGYADASWNDNAIDRRSTSGFVMLVGSTAVSWQSKRQEITALSTAEAEFISATRCGQEACHLRMMLEFLGFPQTQPTVIFEDNNACIQMAQNAANTSRSKHIDLRKFYLKELERRDIVQLIRVSSHDQHADFLTKQVAPESHSRHHRFMAGYPQHH